MQQKFRVFVQKHENRTYTVTLPGIRYIEIEDIEDDLPLSRSLSSYGPILEELKDDLRIALEKWLKKVEPAMLNSIINYREGQSLETVEVEIRPADRTKRKRHDKVKIKLSLLITPEEGGQYLVSVPRLVSPMLSFFCYSLDELKETAAREIQTYFSEHTLEEILEYQYQRQEYLDEIEVSFTPLKPQREKKKKDEKDEGNFWALGSSGVDLSARAKEKKLLHAYRRENEIREILNVLSAERNSSILLVGPSGVGKTAIVHEIVRRIVDDNGCPPPLRNRKVWYTNSDQLIAGCCYIGEWQQKLKNIVDEVKKKRHILHIDDIIGLTEAGRWAKGDENMAQFLKPFISDGTLVIIGEVTPERYSAGERKDPAFLNLFRTLKVEEPGEDAILSILGSVTASLEHEFKVRIPPGVPETVVEITGRFQPYRAFPGKAVLFIEQIAADASKVETKERFVISRHFTISSFARYTGLPEFILSDHLTLDPASVEKFFGERIIGQPDAVATVVDLVTVIKAGLNDPQKPVGCLFFAGPTGVGKTEMAKTLAEYLFGSRERMIRFDMSEYASPVDVARLIGSPMGTEAGELTKQIRLQPFSVVLLDEFEKAHPSIFDVMLQVLGEGRLTDAGGRTADFRSSIIIMTSNLGASSRDQRKPGFRIGDSDRSHYEHFREQVEEFFRPEFVNRLDKIVVFNSLDLEAMGSITMREIGRLLERDGITRRSILVEIDGDTVNLLLQSGFSPVYGARPLKREIERRIIVPLARYLVSQRITSPHLVQVKCENGEVRLSSTPLAEAKQKVRMASTALTEESRRKMDLRELVDGFADLRLRLHGWAESDILRELRNEWESLLADSRRREFIAYGEEAGRIWGRISHLERIVKRLGQLRERAEYLEEFASLARRQQDARYTQDMAENFAGLSRDVEYLEIELLCAHLKDCGRATLRMKPLAGSAFGSKAAAESRRWLQTLAAMYLHWLGRKGYEFEVFLPAEEYAQWLEHQKMPVKSHIPEYQKGPPSMPPWARLKASDLSTLIKRIEDMELSEIAIGVEGTNVYGFLKGEAGVHKLISRGGEREGASAFQTVVVSVQSQSDDDPSTESLLNLRALEEREIRKNVKKSRQDPAPEIIRIYSPEGERFVRDVRTDIRVTRVQEVLDGQIDEFILAYLKTKEPEAAWNE